MQMLLALAALARQLPAERRCRRPLRQEKVEAADNVITQSLRAGEHSLGAAEDSGLFSRTDDRTGCKQHGAGDMPTAEES